MVPESFSIAAMAEEEARETVRWTLGVVKASAPCEVPY